MGAHIFRGRSRRFDKRKKRESLKSRVANIGRPRKLKPEIEEDLIAKNQRLKMELEYLKKLNALVLADERKNDKKR
ncbi:MAG TPA: hypothetical protein VIL24_03310 [Clostridia bacterium]